MPLLLLDSNANPSDFDRYAIRRKNNGGNGLLGPGFPRKRAGTGPPNLRRICAHSARPARIKRRGPTPHHDRCETDATPTAERSSSTVTIPLPLFVVGRITLHVGRCGSPPPIAAFSRFPSVHTAEA